MALLFKYFFPIPIKISYRNDQDIRDTSNM